MTPIPADWTLKALGDVARVYSGGTPNRMVPSYWDGTIPWVSTAEIGTSAIMTTRETISRSGLENSATRIAPAGTLLMAMYGQGKTRGKTSILGIDAAMNQACAAIEPGSEVDSTYLLAYLQCNYDFIRSLSNAGGQENLSGEIVKRIPVILPPFREQVAIGSAYQLAASLVDGLEGLLAKKQAIKQGMMQQVFRNRADSELSPIGSVTSWMSGGTPDRSIESYWTGTIPWISAATLKKVEVSDSDQKVSALGVQAGSKMAPLGSTLVLVRGSALHSEIRASLVIAPVCFNQDVKALVPSAKVVPKFLTYSIHGNANRLLSLVTSAGNTAGVLDTGVLKSFNIWLPDCDEQKRVVAMFDDVTGDLDLLSKRLIKAKSIQQGMMQELLAGRTRLPVTGATA
ncbi:restriction endonuclease subunit S [Dactylosporangium sp. NPDC049525]|uniref:restriction endonuclease subunit S n=1 Tax=Dactylosporangium sp. NPDC049525 TaxID=3154730 RepID=UPI0034160157